jgi:hypothetical protein
MRMHRFIPFVCLLLLAGAGSACRKAPATRAYDEPAATPAPAPAAPVQAVWTTPAGWREEKGSLMRLASFTPGNGSGLCTLIPLEGEAGGRTANVRRWMAQLGLPAMADAELERFMSAQQELRTVGDWPAWIVDFIPLARAAKKPQAMLSAIVSAGEFTIFAKFTGSPALLRANRDRFLELCRSLRSGDRP